MTATLELGIHLLRKAPRENLARFYRLQVAPGLFGNWAVIREWGRIGRPGTVRKDWYATKTDAHQAAEKLLRQKRQRGYDFLTPENPLPA